MENQNGGTPDSGADRKYAILDYTVAVILGLATVLGALAAYYSALWGGNQSSSYNSAIMTMSESSTTYLEALNDYNTMELTDFKDDFVEAQWDAAYKKNDAETMEYYESRMSEPLQKLYKAPDDSMDIVMEEYDAQQEELINDLNSKMDTSIVMYDSAKKHVEVGDKANKNGDEFTLMTVFFTIVLFFGGMSTVTNRYKLKLVYTVISIGLFVYSAIQMLGIPMP